MATLNESPVLRRMGPLIVADKSRVLLRRLYPSSHDKARSIVNKVLALTPEQMQSELEIIMSDWHDRHSHLEQTFNHRCKEVMANIGMAVPNDQIPRHLIGAYFLHEYSIESAALFNPSIVPHMDQSGLPPNCMRFIMSLRATGEGHVSSVTFREGVINANCRVNIKPLLNRISDAKRTSDMLHRDRFVYEVKHSAGRTQGWSTANDAIVHSLVEQLPEEFSLGDLRRVCSHALEQGTPETNGLVDSTVQAVLTMAEANYTVHFDPRAAMSQRVLFPSAPSQSNGIEDARFVQFLNDDGSLVYYATFTAFNGRVAVPQLIETKDFSTVRFIALSGNAIRDKGMALFPRRVRGKFWMLSRQDDENVMIMSSDSVLHWENPTVLMMSEQPWEFFKMGNCGSPLETAKGWLVLTHGVGPMRRYCIGAAMLDLENPTKVIGRMKLPLIAPNEAEREGYVPNVVYSCGALLHGNDVVIPYAMSDSATSFASVSLDELYAAMKLC